MQRIAVLLTCFNRKEKTLFALDALYKAYQAVEKKITIKVYLTDDGSSDGTGDAVRSAYPNITVLQGNGSLYWAGGMRNSWNEALKNKYDSYLLLNDDTFIDATMFNELLETHEYCLNKYGQSGIYVGSTIDANSKKLTYGGSVVSNTFLAKYARVIPNKKNPQECDLGNANIMFVTKSVVDKIGILSKKFTHGLADFDYTLMAKKKNIPVLITANVLGTCTFDHSDPYDTFHKLPLKGRIKKLNHPLGLDFKSNLQFMKRNFIFRLPLVFIAGWVKVIFPKFYFNVLYKTRISK